MKISLFVVIMKYDKSHFMYKIIPGTELVNRKKQ